MIARTLMIIIAYFLGSLSSAVIVSKFSNLPDPREEGSKNPGTTNVLRLGGKIPAALTFLGDLLKGMLPVLLAKLCDVQDIWLGIVALSAFIGHIYPIFFDFKGGKGVATAFGAISALSPLTGILAFAVWIITLILTKYVSIASMSAAIGAAILVTFLTNSSYVVPVLLIATLIIFRHLPNIRRLKNHTENKIKF